MSRQAEAHRPGDTLTPLRAGLCRLLLIAACAVPAATAWSQKAPVPDAIERIKPSIVAVGTYQKSRSPRFQFYGTGFAVGDGTLVATNAHVLPAILDAANQESLVVATGTGTELTVRTATRSAVDPDHDMAVLRIAGAPLPTLKLRDELRTREGEELLFTGFPLGTSLGLYPVTHRAMVAAIVPISMPLPSANSLDPKVVRRVRQGGFPVLQLDATAYPGNSGSPVYDVATGEVIGVVNMVFVKGTKEAALTAPSGITYAIPVNHLRSLIGQ